ncbi:DUF1700 domain-containing protein [Aquibacillus kalidii]|uniref:HAAS domain-containing protein n=1 Tax=Aquibacillus kalidii TaxID=2762597 RepID=UPI001645E153|nr:DUF1700 domain-containing protein [Aquibacillus kalidii]
MNKKAFIRELDYHIRKIPKIDRVEILHEVEEHFVLGDLDGKTENEVAMELGGPKVMARDVLLDYQATHPQTERPRASHSDTNIARAIIAGCALFLFNLIFVLGPAVGIIGVYISFFAVGVSLSLSPIAWVGSIVFGTVTNMVAEFFVVLTLCSLGVLLTIAMVYVGKYLFKGFAAYFKFNARIIKG